MSYIVGVNKALDPNGQLVDIPVAGRVFTHLTPLLSNQSVSTGWIPRGNFQNVLYIIQSPQPGTIAAIEYSEDGLTTSSVGTARSYLGGNLSQIALSLKSSYFRITYTNGVTPQTSFYFEVSLSPTPFQATMASLFQAPTATNMALLTASVFQTPDTGGVYAPLTRTGTALDVNIASGSLPISDGGGSLTVDGMVSVSGTVPVSGTFWQSTQPVSIASMPTTPVTGTFWQATQPVSIASSVAVTGPLTDTQLRASAIPVSGTFFQATQPVSIAAPVAVTGPLTDTQLRATALPVSLSTLPAGTNAVGNINELRAATTSVTATGAAAAAVTLTLPAPGAGLFHYITSYEIRLYSTAARTGVATPIVVTTTNIAGSPAFTFDTVGAIGTTIAQTSLFPTPTKTSVANTATTIVAPAVTGGLWRITVYYFTAP
jgi:hypothetical protein